MAAGQGMFIWYPSIIPHQASSLLSGVQVQHGHIVVQRCVSNIGPERSSSTRLQLQVHVIALGLGSYRQLSPVASLFKVQSKQKNGTQATNETLCDDIGSRYECVWRHSPSPRVWGRGIPRRMVWWMEMCRDVSHHPRSHICRSRWCRRGYRY